MMIFIICNKELVKEEGYLVLSTEKLNMNVLSPVGGSLAFTALYISMYTYMYMYM